MPSRRADGELNVLQVERVPTLDKDGKEGKIQTQPGAAGGLLGMLQLSTDIRYSNIRELPCPLLMGVQGESIGQEPLKQFWSPFGPVLTVQAVRLDADQKAPKPLDFVEQNAASLRWGAFRALNMTKTRLKSIRNKAANQGVAKKAKNTVQAMEVKTRKQIITIDTQICFCNREIESMRHGSNGKINAMLVLFF